jgi:DNA-binding MarR family transcriptional regulator
MLDADSPADRPHHSDIALLVDEVSRLKGRLTEVFAPANDAALSGMERTVLAATQGAASPPTVAQIGRSLGHPRQVIQRAANSLVQKGLIRMEANPDHKRASLLLCTPGGAAVRHKDTLSAAAITEALMDAINPADLAKALHLLRSLRRQIETHVKERRP